MGQGRSPRPTWQRAIARLQDRETVAESGPLLVLANLVALIGVLFLGWNLAMILVLYWVESGIVGLLNLPKILLARGPLTLTARGRLVGRADGQHRTPEPRGAGLHRDLLSDPLRDLLDRPWSLRVSIAGLRTSTGRGRRGGVE